MIYANISSTFENAQSLEYTIESIYDQFDEINIYTTSIETIKDKKINYHIAKEDDSNGKFYFTKDISGFYFTIDDNRIYPPNYVKSTLPRLATYDVICYGGRNYKSFPMVRYETSASNILRAEQSQTRDIYVQFADTGTMAFHTNDFKIRMTDFEIPNITDVITGCLLKERKKRVVSLKHDKGWVVYRQRPKEPINEQKTIYVNNNFNKSKKSNLLLKKKVDELH